MEISCLRKQKQRVISKKNCICNLKPCLALKWAVYNNQVNYWKILHFRKLLCNCFRWHYLKIGWIVIHDCTVKPAPNTLATRPSPLQWISFGNSKPKFTPLEKVETQISSYFRQYFFYFFFLLFFVFFFIEKGFLCSFGAGPGISSCRPEWP